jgi:hypothetical protein
MQILNCILSVVCSFLLFTFLGCGSVKDAEKQENPDLRVTASAAEELNDDGLPLALTDLGDEIFYNSGSLLLWNPQASPALIAAVSEASIRARATKAAELKYNRGELQPLEAAYAKKVIAKNDAKKAVQLAEESQSKSRRPLAENWFNQRLLQLKNELVLTAADLDAAKKNFAAYCEYKIWELATHSLLQQKLLERPTPLAMCEPVYAERGYLNVASEACSPASTATGKDYFPCLWNEGVLLTSLFTPLAEPTCGGTSVRKDQKRGDVVREWLANGVLRAALFDPELANPLATKSFGEMLRNDFLLKRVSFTGDFSRHAELTTCKKAFKFQPLGDGSLADRDLSELKLMVEENPSRGVSLTLLPMTGDLGRDEARWKMLGEPLFFIGARSGASASVNDRLFNKAVGAELATFPAYEDGVSASPFFADLRRAAQAPAALLIKLRAESEAVKVLKRQLKATQQKSLSLSQQARVADQKSAQTGAAPGAALAISGMSLRLKRHKSMLEVHLMLQNATGALVGCATLTNSGCLIEKTPGTMEFSDVTFDAINGILSVNISLADPAAVGLGLLPRRDGEPTFVEVLPANLKGRDLRLEFYPNRLDGTLDFYTGKAFIKSGDLVELEGSMSGAAYK